MGITAFGPESWHSCSQANWSSKSTVSLGTGAGDRLAEPPGHVGGESDTTGARLAPRKTECSGGQGADAWESCAVSQPAAEGWRKRGGGQRPGSSLASTEVRSRFCRKVSQLVEKNETLLNGYRILSSGK